MNIEDYINQRVDDQILWYDKKSTRCQKSYKTLQIIEIIAAALIPLLAGYSNVTAIAIIVGILGALIAVIESISKLYKFHENWIEYRTTCELLRYEKNLYLTKTSPYNTEEETKENLFVKNIEAIISSENNKWKNIFSSVDKTKKSNQ